MREIKFRGLDYKDIWRYGYFWVAPDGTHFIKESIARTHSADFAVIPETIGEYTNYKDKDNKEIYENDIFNDYSIVKFIASGYWLEDKKGNLTSLKDYWILNGIEKVIGNIHENPELLKGNEE